MSIIITTQTRTNIISINIGINNSKILQYSILSNLLEKEKHQILCTIHQLSQAGLTIGNERIAR